MKEAEKRELIAKVPKTQSPSGVRAGGGVAFLGYKSLFPKIRKILTGITPLLRPAIAMNKRNMTGRTCHVDTILISPFDNCNNSGCNGAAIPAPGYA